MPKTHIGATRKALRALVKDLDKISRDLLRLRKAVGKELGGLVGKEASARIVEARKAVDRVVQIFESLPGRAEEAAAPATAAATPRRKKAARKKAARRSSAKKTAGRKKTAKKTTRKATGKSGKKAPAKARPGKTRKKAARKTASRKKTSTKAGSS